MISLELSGLLLSVVWRQIEIPARTAAALHAGDAEYGDDGPQGVLSPAKAHDG
jgi:hypothetical protein